MVKFFSFLLIIVVVLFCTNTKAFKAKTIDLKIKDDEVSVVFIKLKGSISLLINDDDDSNLFIIQYKNDEYLKSVLKIFKSNPNVFYLNRDIDKIIDNVHVFKLKDVLKFTINNYTLCVNEKSIDNCDFVYLLDLDGPFKINENISNVFYDESLNKKYLKSLEESWVDSTIVSEDSFTILKITEESYNILVVPSTK